MGCNHVKMCHNKCDECLVFHVFGVKICMNVVSLEYFI